MDSHDPLTCEKVPFTAYYSNGTWSWRVRCPACGNERRQHLNTDGRAEMQCNGQQIEAALSYQAASHS